MPPVKKFLFSCSCLPVAGIPSPAYHNTVAYKKVAFTGMQVVDYLIVLPKTVESFPVPITLTEAMTFFCLLGFCEEGILRIQWKLLQVSKIIILKMMR